MALSRPLSWALLAFAFTAVASIALQNILLGVIALLFLWEKFRSPGRYPWPQNLFIGATLLFLASFYLGAVVGLDPSESFKTVHKYLALLVIPVIGAIPLAFSDLKKLLRVLVRGGALCGLYGILFVHFIQHQDRITSFSGDKMVFGGMLMVCLLFQTLFLKEDPRSPKEWAIALLLAAALVMTQTRGAWLGFAAGFALLTFRWDRRWLLGGLLMMLAAFCVVPKTWQERLLRPLHFRVHYDVEGHPDAANEVRFMIWAGGWRIAQEHPWGIGQGNLGKVAAGAMGPTLMGYEPDLPHLHNNFLQILVQNGWQGLTLYVLWIVVFGWMALRSRPPDQGAAEWNWAFFSVFAAVLAWGLSEYTFSHQFMNFQFFLLGLQARLWDLSPRSGNAKGSKGRRSRPSR